MKILVISDAHGNTENIEKLADKFGEADMVLFAGDFAEFKRPETSKPTLESILKRHECIFSVIGNCDDPSFLSEIENADISVEKSLVFHEGLAIAGCGGGTKFTGETLFERTEEEIMSDFQIVTNSAEQCADENGHWSNLVLIMHNPPKDTKCDMLPNGVHVGSELLRKFIETNSPLLVVTGHIHEAVGIDTIGTTTIINPGSLAEGRYGWIELDDSLKVKTAELFTL